MKKVLLALLFCLSAGIVFGQAAYRSRQTGNWNQVTTWQVFNGGIWKNLETVVGAALPSNASGIITISSGTTVTIPNALEVNADQVEFGTTLPMGTLQVAFGGTFNILNGPGHDLRFYNDGVNFSQFLVSGLFRLRNNATIVNDNYAGTVLPASNPTTVNTYKVLNGGAQVHNSTDALPYADWQIGSTFVFYATNTNPDIDDVSIQFYNFTWEGTPQTQALSLSGNLRNINGNFRVNSTAGRSLSLGTTSDYTMNVGGNFTVLGNSLVTLNTTATSVLNIGTVPTPGNFEVSSGTVNLNTSGNTDVNVSGDFLISGGTVSLTTLSGTTNTNIRGNFSQTGGSITRTGTAGSANINFTGSSTTSTFTKTGGSIINAVNYSVVNGRTLDLGTSALTGSGSLTLFNGSILQVKALDAGGAIQNNTSGGNIRVSGVRTYDAGSTLVYNGAAPQFIGAGHPAIANTTINNPNSVSLAGSVTINGALDLTDGILWIEGNTLTVGGAFSRTGGFFGVSPTSNMIINGSGDFIDLVLFFAVTGSNMNNLTINRTGGTVYLGASVNINGTFTQTAGNFSLGQFNAFALTLRGDVVQSGGAILVFANSSLIVEGAGALPADLNMIGPDLFNLTMNRDGGTLRTTSALSLVELNLFNGIVDNPNLTIAMGDGGLVRRHSGGSITNVLGTINNESSYSVIYDIAMDIDSGRELPFLPVTHALANLIKRGPATLFLQNDIVVNGSLDIEAGTFFGDSNNDITILRNFNIDGVFTTESILTFAGNTPQTISGTNSVTLPDVVVNQTSASTLDISTNVDVLNSLTVTSASAVNAGNQLLRLVSNASQTAYVAPLNAGASINGTVIVERHLPNSGAIRAYRYITPSVSGSSVGDWKTELSITGKFSDPVTGPGIISKNFSMYVYNETFTSGGPNLEDRYMPYPTSGLASANPIFNGRGYAVFGRTTGAITFDSRGTLGQGPTPINVANSGGANGGWNLIGNPYPAPIDWDPVAATFIPNGIQVDNAIYYTDNVNNSGGGNGSKVTYINGVGVPASYQGIIASGQAFWVHANSNSTIIFQEPHKVNAQTQFLRKTEITNLLRVALKSGSTTDEVALRLHEDASDSFDGKFDALKFPSSSLALSMLTVNNKKVAVNSISSLVCGQTIPLVIDGAAKGNYTLDFSGFESFEAGMQLHLKDKLVDQLIDITTTKQYSFTTSDGVSLQNRFELVVDMPPIQTTLNIAGESVCENSTVAYVTISNSQPNVEYKVQWNGADLSAALLGNGNLIQIPVNVESLPQGELEVTIMASRGYCSSIAMSTKARLSVIATEAINEVENGTICGPGNVVVKVKGTGVRYNWYEDREAIEPIAGAESAEFITPVLEKSKTYYVAAVNALGCEGELVAVLAEVVYTEQVSITQDGNVLISNFEEGNKWFLDGVELANGNSNQLEALISGTYSVEVMKHGCKTTAFRELNVTEAEGTLAGGLGVSVYPNPTKSKVTVEVNSLNNGSMVAKLISPIGMELGTLKLKGENGKHSGEFDLMVYPIGVYLIQIRDGQKLHIKKISKIK